MLVWRFVAHLGLAPVLLGACYTYHPIQTPSPEQKVSVVLTDSGRVESARQIGPETQRIEGSFLSADDTAYLLAVASVKPIGRDWVRWSGEEVSVRREYVAQLYERRTLTSSPLQRTQSRPIGL